MKPGETCYILTARSESGDDFGPFVFTSPPSEEQQEKFFRDLCPAEFDDGEGPGPWGSFLRAEALITSAKGQTRRAHTLPRVRVTEEARANIAASRMSADVTTAISAAQALCAAGRPRSSRSRRAALPRASPRTR